MSFLRKIINQIDRDMYSVASTQIFQDAHATPYKRIQDTIDIDFSYQRITFRSDFEKAIAFQTAYSAKVLINKLSGIYSLLKNQINAYIKNGYLDIDEADELFMMIQQFSGKADDVRDILELDEEANQKQIEQLSSLLAKTNELIKNVLKVSADGCYDKKAEMEQEAAEVKSLSFIKFVALHGIWLGKYASTGRINWVAMIFANFLSFLCSFIPNIFMLIYGAMSYSGENDKRKELKNLYLNMADLEEQRAVKYMNAA